MYTVLLCLLGWGSIISQANETGIYTFSGEVVEVQPTGIQVRDHSEVRVFSSVRTQANEYASKLKKGDSVLIQYSLELRGVSVLESEARLKARQRPGVQGEKKEVLDDRAFYGA